jgi:DNA-binding PadR family transcriptional regulator
MQEEPRLTPTSYIVLGFLSWSGAPTTPYALKGMVARSVGYFWTLQHAQLYTEPERLARGGYVTEKREPRGRRRRLYTITAKGEEALAAWRAEPTGEIPELRNQAVLKLFFGADPAKLAPLQLEAHRRRLAEYEEIRAALPKGVPEGPRLALASGIDYERQQIAWWEAYCG